MILCRSLNFFCRGGLLFWVDERLFSKELPTSRRSLLLQARFRMELGAWSPIHPVNGFVVSLTKPITH